MWTMRWSCDGSRHTLIQVIILYSLMCICVWFWHLASGVRDKSSCGRDLVLSEKTGHVTHFMHIHKHPTIVSTTYVASPFAKVQAPAM